MVGQARERSGGLPEDSWDLYQDLLGSGVPTSIADEAARRWASGRRATMPWRKQRTPQRCLVREHARRI